MLCSIGNEDVVTACSASRETMLTLKDHGNTLSGSKLFAV